MTDLRDVCYDGKPAFYALLYSKLRESALECGWALAVHGSLATDIDLIAVAWSSDSSSVEDLIGGFYKVLDGTVWSTSEFSKPRTGPAGRVVYTIPIASSVYIDLNVFDNRKREEGLMHQTLTPDNECATHGKMAKSRHFYPGKYVCLDCQLETIAKMTAEASLPEAGTHKSEWFDVEACVNCSGLFNDEILSSDYSYLCSCGDPVAIKKRIRRVYDYEYTMKHILQRSNERIEFEDEI